VSRVLREYSKSEMVKIIEHATRKEFEARTAYNSVVARLRLYVAAAAAVSTIAGGGLVWWFLG
jgi:fatty acid desaturase